MTALSGEQARRVALAAQGFADPPARGEPTRTHLRRVVGRTGLLQMDSVNILARAHYLPVFSRIGQYDDGIVDRAAWQHTARSPRLLAEYWAHEAALIPVEDWPLFGWRMRQYRGGRYRQTREVLQRNAALAADVRDVIVERGATTPSAIEAALGVERATGVTGSWWNRSAVKHVCEALFASGDLSSIRDAHFARHYDLADRVIGADRVGIEVPERDAHRALVSRAARSHGIATVADLADYHRIRIADVRAVLGDLLDAGEITEATVDGWRDQAYLHRDARIPRSVSRSTLLSPFDPLVFYRPRAERLFRFRYRIEIYVPEHKRVHGYYVLPYLMGESLTARVDLKADRGARVLRVLAAHVEEGCDPGAVAESLAADLRRTAHWRGLDDVDVRPRGDLASELAWALRA
ncbi:winged helix-turn-helix domain-containing protein [Gordonia zhaorongruii]|uniref:winged helix-turn-helix domain-containing protein n=1 Tax=Gordonia zhaorongruii TaxID=2597659 RepID=UPI00104B20F2|nr:crosslink repair DNA glycosylase YcaQ family protein [Gordonia zhaorongruii]